MRAGTRWSPRCDLAAGAILFACLAVCPFAQASEAVARVVLVGDSITVGPRDGAISYSDLLSLALADTHEVVNLAVSGTATHDWLPDQECTSFCEGADGLFGQKVKPALPADIVVVLLGTNDAMGPQLRGPPSPDAYTANVRKLSRALLDGGAAQIVLMTPPPIGGRDEVANPIQARVASYAAQVRKLCKELDRIVCGPDLFRLIDREKDFIEGDVLHPNQAAHTRIGAALADVVRELSPEPKKRKAKRRRGAPG